MTFVLRVLPYIHIDNCKCCLYFFPFSCKFLLTTCAHVQFVDSARLHHYCCRQAWFGLCSLQRVEKKYTQTYHKEVLCCQQCTNLHLDGIPEATHSLVKCNFGLNPSDPLFQVATTTSPLAEYPVAFQCTLRYKGHYDTVGVVPCSETPVNVGNAMSTAGIFTVPFDGVYLFSFSAPSFGDHVETVVNIRADALQIGGLYIMDRYSTATSGTEDDELAGSRQVVARLRRGQKVDSYLASGYLSQYTRFVGHLLFPE